MIRYSKMLVYLLVINGLIMSGTALAQGLKERMQSRLPTIVDLKARGIVGEDSQGFLAFVKGQKEKPDVVAAENKDRQTVYQTIAKREGTTAQLVGQRRAKQLADRAKPGEWLQNAKGQWHQKK